MHWRFLALQHAYTHQPPPPPTAEIQHAHPLTPPDDLAVTETCKREITVRESSFFSFSFFFKKAGPGRHMIWIKETEEQKMTVKMWDQTEGERRNGQTKPKKAQFLKKITPFFFWGRRLLIGLRVIFFKWFFLSIFECILGLQNSLWSGTTEATLKLLPSLVNGLLNKHRFSVSGYVWGSDTSVLHRKTETRTKRDKGGAGRWRPRWAKMVEERKWR